MMIDSDNVSGYTSTDSEYATELWDAVRRTLTFEEATELVKGEHPGVSREGIEAMELYLTEPLLTGGQRPPTVTGSSYERNVIWRLEQLPERLALHAWHGELELAKSGMSTTEWKIEGVIAVLTVGEDYFDVDLSDEIVEWAKSLPESESKIDLLEERGAITGEEWNRRYTALEADNEYPPTA